MEKPREIDKDETVQDLDITELEKEQVVIKSDSSGGGVEKDKTDITSQPVDDE